MTTSERLQFVHDFFVLKKAKKERAEYGQDWTRACRAFRRTAYGERAWWRGAEDEQQEIRSGAYGAQHQGY